MRGRFRRRGLSRMHPPHNEVGITAFQECRRRTRRPIESISLRRLADLTWAMNMMRRRERFVSRSEVAESNCSPPFFHKLPNEDPLV